MTRHSFTPIYVVACSGDIIGQLLLCQVVETKQSPNLGTAVWFFDCSCHFVAVSHEFPKAEFMYICVWMFCG